MTTAKKATGNAKPALAPDEMSIFIRGVKKDVWRRFRAAAALEGVDAKDLFIRVIEEYAKKRVKS